MPVSYTHLRAQANQPVFQISQGHRLRRAAQSRLPGQSRITLPSRLGVAGHHGRKQDGVEPPVGDMKLTAQTVR